MRWMTLLQSFRQKNQINLDQTQPLRYNKHIATKEHKMSFIKVDTRKSRAYTCAVLELVDQGALDQKDLINDLLSWMDEADVKQFCNRHLSELFEEDEEESDKNDDDEEWDAMEPCLEDYETEPLLVDEPEEWGTIHIRECSTGGKK